MFGADNFPARCVQYEMWPEPGRQDVQHGAAKNAESTLLNFVNVQLAQVYSYVKAASVIPAVCSIVRVGGLSLKSQSSTGPRTLLTTVRTL
jgi:hypothetical protein